MTGREQVGRRASASAMPSLALVFVAFFLPTIPSCNGAYTPIEWVGQAVAVTALWLGRRGGWEGLAWRVVAWWALFSVSAPVFANLAIGRWPPPAGAAVALAGWLLLPVAMAVAVLSAWVARGRTLLVGEA